MSDLTIHRNAGTFNEKQQASLGSNQRSNALELDRVELSTGQPSETPDRRNALALPRNACMPPSHFLTSICRGQDFAADSGAKTAGPAEVLQHFGPPHWVLQQNQTIQAHAANKIGDQQIDAQLRKLRADLRCQLSN